MLTTTEIFVARFKPSFSFGFQSHEKNKNEAKLLAATGKADDDVIVSSLLFFSLSLVSLRSCGLFCLPVLFALLFWALNSPDRERERHDRLSLFEVGLVEWQLLVAFPFTKRIWVLFSLGGLFNGLAR